LQDVAGFLQEAKSSAVSNGTLAEEPGGQGAEKSPARAILGDGRAPGVGELKLSQFWAIHCKL